MTVAGETGVQARRRLTRGRLVALVVVIALILIWWQRQEIAERAIGRYLADRGVPATYRVTGIGPRWERLENVVIGDPANPDLTARRVEVRLGGWLSGVRVSEVRAEGVRLNARLIDGRVRVGAIDRLLPPPSGAPFTLPDLTVRLTDARVTLASPFGRTIARIDGAGNLADGFRGRAAAQMARLTTKPCIANALRLDAEIAISQRAPLIRGPLTAETVVCGATRITAPTLRFDATLGPALDRWSGGFVPDVAQIAAPGVVATRVTGTVGFAGTIAQTTGRAQVAAASARIGAQAMRRVAADLSYQLSDDRTGAHGTIRVADAPIDPALGIRVARATQGLAATPLAPLARELAQAVARARSASGSARLAARLDAGGLRGSIARADVATDSGARLTLGEGRGVRFGGGVVAVDATARLFGGGLPRITAQVRRGPDGWSRGVATMAPWQAGDATLALTPVRFGAGPGGEFTLATDARLSGPLADGRIDDLRMAVRMAGDARGRIVVNPGCTPIALSALRVSTLRLDPTRLTACATGVGAVVLANGRVSGGVRIAAPRLTGAIGTTPLSAAAAAARVGANGALVFDRVAMVIGPAAKATRIAIATLDGRIARGGVDGMVAGLTGTIANVPLTLSDGAGPFSFRGGALSLDGRARVADQAVPPRFVPLEAAAMRFRLDDGRIVARAQLVTPATRTPVARVSIAHMLASGRGTADLTVDDLRFGDALQPEALTPLTLGLVANVRGAISGAGTIRWSPAGVTSTGAFATEGLDLAAAFGPVTGLKGRIAFDDLLGLTTGDQVIEIGAVNPGIPVVGGQVRYRLLPDRHIAILGGSWPFAGGSLILDPTTLDMGRPVARRLTFRLDGFDAAKFVDTLQFDNIAATGLFDGVIPMVFDDAGGRIENGRIKARAPGGTLSYVGAVSNSEKLPVYGQIAFDVLKSLRYRDLTIDLAGPLDGEMVTRFTFDGIASNADQARQNFIVRRIMRLPFRFNITMRGPFRALIATARGFQDPSLLLQRLRPPPPAVQPLESSSPR